MAVGRWPLAVGRWPLAVGRWPLAVGALSALSCLSVVKPAHAGEWLVEVKSSDGKVFWPVRIPPKEPPFWDDAQVVPESILPHPWVMPPNNGLIRIGEMNLLVGDTTGGSEDNTNTWDSAPTPQNKNTRSEVSGSLQVICKWKAAAYDGETGQWTPDGSKPTERELKLTVDANVGAYGSVSAPLDQGSPGDGAVAVDVAGLGAPSDTVTTGHREETSSDRTLWRYSSQTKRKVFVLPVPQTASASGDYKIEFSLMGIYAKSHIETGFHGTGLASASAFYDIKSIDRIKLNISSNIETSWKKWTGSVSNLPDDYKLRDSAGPLVNLPNDNAVLVWSHPTDASKDVWKLACLRGSDGKLTVESAADYDENLEIWRGNIELGSNATGYIQPKYEWTQSGGSTSSGTPSPFPGSTWNLSGAIDALRFSNSDTSPVGSSAFTLKVEELEPSLPAIIEEDAYDVNWHMPLEKVAQTTNVSMKAFVKSLTGQIDPDGSAHRYVAKDEDFDIEGVLDGAAVVTGALGQEEITVGLEGMKKTLKVFKAVTSITNLIFHHPGDGPDVTENTTTEFYNNSGTWSTAMGDDSQSQNFEPGSEPSEDEKTDPKGYKHYYMIMKEVKHFHHKEWQADRYNSHGFVDDQGVVKANPVDGIDHEPYYIRKPGFPAGQDGGQ